MEKLNKMTNAYNKHFTTKHLNENNKIKLKIFQILIQQKVWLYFSFIFLFIDLVIVMLLNVCDLRICFCKSIFSKYVFIYTF